MESGQESLSQRPEFYVVDFGKCERVCWMGNRESRQYWGEGIKGNAICTNAKSSSLQIFHENELDLNGGFECKFGK